ncbi:pyridoxal-dependent decarboxylase [Pseudonocardia ailaonensis]|uniref:Pyridoxal-dependent decarboxylase n=1 Tax=Pseudonocardia ailaonensis TaxID=367279 RepID=A0ABN2MRB6_9PSEU
MDLSGAEFRRAGYALVDWVAAHREGMAELPVRPSVEPGSIRAALPAALPDAPVADVGAALTSLLDDVVVPGSLLWQHPGFFGYFPAQASLLSLLGDIASGGIGSQGMLWSTAPAGTEIEQVLVDGFATALGLGEAFTFAGGGGGSLQDSASSAALVALLAALHRSSPAWQETGIEGTERVYVTAETHSSLAKAVRVAGLGSRALRIVPFSPGTRVMDADALAEHMSADRAAGLRPVLVCPTVGTTGVGAIDPVRAICGVAQGVWVHVDAAWAGVASLCPEFRYVLDGAELADSVCTDAHKWLGTAFDASFLWVRDGRALPAALSITPEYLRNAATDSGAVVDYRDWQVPLGRRMRALKLWAVVHGTGLDGLREQIRAHVALTTSLATRIEAEPGFALAAPPSLALVCLHLTGPDGSPDDAATRAALEAVNADGDSFVTHTTVDGRYAIRVAVGALGTGPEHVDRLWQALRAARD